MRTQFDGSAMDRPAPVWLRLAAGLSAALAGWWGMMAIHELGHVIGAGLTGGRVGRVDLPLIGFSQTQLAHNPQPLIVVWAGPVLGILLPTAAWAGLMLLRRHRMAPLPTAAAAYFAGFCLIANGIYIGLGWLDRVGDTGDMLRHGTPATLMAGFGVVSCAAGLALWHTLGPWLGLRAITTQNACRLLFAGMLVAASGVAVSVAQWLTR